MFTELELMLLVRDSMIWLFVAFVLFGIIDLIFVATTTLSVARLVKSINTGKIVLKASLVEAPTVETR